MKRPLHESILVTGHRYDGVHNPMQHAPRLPQAHPALHGLGMVDPRTPIRNGTLANALLEGEDNEMVFLPGTTEFTLSVADVRKMVREIYGHTPESFSKLPSARQDKIVDKMKRTLRRELKRHVGATKRPPAASPVSDDEMAKERGRVYNSLREWARGPLTLENPRSSSLHHLTEYDLRHTAGTFASELQRGDLQSILVEHEWARVVPPDGVWRMPFRDICWEFRLSGVRVLAVTYMNEDTGESTLLAVYGHDGHWVCDDLIYEIDAGGSLRLSKKQHRTEDIHSFYRAVHVVFENIRASCIMMDAGMCRRETVAASPKLVQKRKEEGRPPPRDYSVVRLDRQRPAYRVARGAGASATGSQRAPQRGHWRRGNWFHYDDPDSGQEVYANDGGFFVSKTWRSYYFAGNPNDLMPNREYRI